LKKPRADLPNASCQRVKDNCAVHINDILNILNFCH
jgi:hypothetical protein